MPLHPAIASRLHMVKDLPGILQAVADEQVVDLLEEYHRHELPTISEVNVSEETLPGPHGDIRIRRYSPQAPKAKPVPGLVWLHGGGFMAGDLDLTEADLVARELCRRRGVVVVSVEYRLAIGGISHPVPVEDVVAAVRWFRGNAVALGVAADAISVGGCSAGAALAAGAVLRLRDADSWSPVQLLLAYPLVHPTLPAASPALASAMEDIPRFHRFLPEDIRVVVENYLGGPASAADAYAFAALGDLAGLCPTLVLNAEFDDLRASGEAFAAALAAAGVEVEQVLVPGTLHGFLNGPWGIEPVDLALDVLARRLGCTGQAS